jgi:hypothetical protein
MEFPHLLNLIKYKQFDTIYHEHFSYLDLLAVNRIFGDNGLKLYDVQKLETHGGSLRIFAAHAENTKVQVSSAVKDIIDEETEFGLDSPRIFEEFGRYVQNLKFSIWNKITELKKEDKTIVGYGAAAKGNTLFNFCGIKNDVISYVADMNPYKQNLHLPGSLIPIVSPDKIKETKPDYIVIIPWNLKQEIMQQLEYVREWGCKFVTFMPEVQEY